MKEVRKYSKGRKIQRNGGIEMYIILKETENDRFRQMKRFNR